MPNEKNKMGSKNTSRIVTTILTGITISIVALVLPKLLVPGVVPSLLTTQVLELILALLAIGILGKGRFFEYGFRLPRIAQFSLTAVVKWILIAFAAVAMGALTALVTILSGAGGHPILQQLSLPQIMLFTWVFASIVEEILVRGFIQGHLSPWNETNVKLLLFQVSVPTLVGALFFGVMHTILLLAGADALTTIIIVIFTFSLGLLAGHQRAKSESLIPAIILHTLANIGSVLSGVVYAILTVLITGRPPEI
jgi:membrane protease YdiL (CAAX protease family)